MSLISLRRQMTRGAAVMTATLALVSLQNLPVLAQATPVPAGSVLLFPAVVSDAPDGAKLAEEVVTDAVRAALIKAGISTVVHSRRLASIQRAVNEGVIRKEDAEKGPGDDRRKAQIIAGITGASEFVTVFVDDYKFDAKTRTATFQLSVSRYSTTDGVAIGSIAKPQVGVAPADVVTARQEGSALARAADSGADQMTSGLFPIDKMRELAMPRKGKKRASLGVTPTQTTVVVVTVPVR